MQIPVFIVEEYKESEDSEVMKIRRDLILLHWGLKAVYFPVEPDGQVSIPMSTTVGICRDPRTGQTLEIAPEFINFHADERIMI